MLKAYSEWKKYFLKNFEMKQNLLKTYNYVINWMNKKLHYQILTN